MRERLRQQQRRIDHVNGESDTATYGAAVTTNIDGSGDISNQMGASDIANAYGSGESLS